MRATFIIGINHKQDMKDAERLLIVFKPMVSANNHCLPTKIVEIGDLLRRSRWTH